MYKLPKDIKTLNVAKAVVALEDTEGWKHFVALVEGLIQANTPNVSTFTGDEAVKIAAQMAFVTGMKRCIGLMDQQKDILKDK